jgi:hypothetical protein
LIRIPSPDRPATPIETWNEEVDLFCPGCGVKGKSFSEGDGCDYYLGPEHLCIACGASFYLPREVNREPDDARTKRLDSLRKTITVQRKPEQNLA